MSLPDPLSEHRRQGSQLRETLAAIDERLTHAKAEVLAGLARCQPATAGEVARSLPAVPPGTVRNALHLFRQWGWARYPNQSAGRAPGGKNRRPRGPGARWRMQLTAEGRAVAERLFQSSLAALYVADKHNAAP